MLKGGSSCDYREDRGDRVDFNDMNTPVMSHESLRPFFAVASRTNFPLHHFGVKAALLHGDLSEKVFMSHPPEFERKDQRQMV